MVAKSVVIAVPDRGIRAHLSTQIGQLDDFRVVSQTADLMNTFTEVEQHQGSVVLIAQSLASQPEFEVMRGLFSALDIRWLVLADGGGGPAPAQGSKSDLFALSAEAAASQLGAHLRSLTRSRTVPSPPKTRALAPAAATPQSNGIVLIGASTGGVDALLAVLRHFDNRCPPVLVVQHTGSGFGKSLAALLDRQCQARVCLVEQDMPLQAGNIYIGAGSGAHLVLQSGHTLRCGLQKGGNACGHTPSVDVLFRSAVPVANRVSAALLTGMGRDGGSAMRALRDAGAATIAQDQATSVVFGMPRAAIEAGGAAEVLPLDQIGPALLTQSARQARREHI